MLSRGRDDDDGFTMVELLVSIAVLGVVMVGLVAVMFGAMRTNVETKTRLDETRDQQLAASYFGPDAQAATSILTAVTAGCGTGSAAVEFRGSSYDQTTLAASVTVVSYVFATAVVGNASAGQLQRQSCETAAVPAPTYPLVVKTKTLVARNLVITSPTSVCTPAPCGPTSTSVTLTASRRSGDAPFLLVGTRRTTVAP